MNALKTHEALRLSMLITFRRGFLFLIVKNVVRDTIKDMQSVRGVFCSTLELWEERVVIIKSTKDARRVFTRDEACSHETPHRLLRLSLRMLTLALDGL